jgi:hypothetical protein
MVTTNESSCATATTESDGSRAREVLLHTATIRGTSTKQSPNKWLRMIESTMVEIAVTTNSAEMHIDYCDE